MALVELACLAPAILPATLFSEVTAAHRPEQTTLYRLVQQHAATFFAQAEDAAGADLPQFVKDEFGRDTRADRRGASGRALVPRPRLHLIRFYGVLAPNAKLRALVVPQEAEASAQEATSAECEANCGKRLAKSS